MKPRSLAQRTRILSLAPAAAIVLLTQGCILLHTRAPDPAPAVVVETTSHEGDPETVASEGAGRSTDETSDDGDDGRSYRPAKPEASRPRPTAAPAKASSDKPQRRPVDVGGMRVRRAN